MCIMHIIYLVITINNLRRYTYPDSLEVNVLCLLADVTLLVLGLIICDNVLCETLMYLLSYGAKINLPNISSISMPLHCTQNELVSMNELVWPWPIDP